VKINPLVCELKIVNIGCMYVCIYLYVFYVCTCVCMFLSFEVGMDAIVQLGA
jgi:hypothetical protein